MLLAKFEFLNKSNRKSIEKWLCLKQTITQATRRTLRGKYYAGACVMLNARTVPAAFARVEFCTYSFIIASFLEQTSEDCIGNTEHVNVNAECNSK